MTTVIIPTCPGNEHSLDLCLSSIARTTKECVNIIVIKNNFEGFAKAVNRGILMATTEKGSDDIILLNDDCTMMANWYEILNDKTKDFDIIGHIGSMKDNNHVPFYFVYIKGEILDKIGILDERFEIGEWEDVDFCLRALESGFKIGEVDIPCVKHITHLTMNKLTPEQQEIRYKNKQIFKDKWKGTKWENFWK
jgi:GT2 family glycosyltransferase